MKKVLERDIVDVGDILESLVKKLPSMTEAELIDVAARLKPVAKNIELIDTHVKDHVKAKLKHKEGVINGGIFNAELKLVPIDRLDQKSFKELKPAMYLQFVKEAVDERVSYKVR